MPAASTSSERAASVEDRPPRDFVAVVVAAGRSERFGGELPKQFQELAGRTVLERAIDCLVTRPAVLGAVVVLAPEEAAGTRGREVRRMTGVLDVVPGGAVRAESVRRGLAAAVGATNVLVHDAARPLAAAALVDAVIEATREHGAAVPLLALHDTIKRRERGFVTGTEDRDSLARAQTPQGARLDWLVPALDRALAEGSAPTDESAALEAAGRRVAEVPGDPSNLKITTAADLEDARRTLGAGRSPLRIGTGFDIHRRQAGVASTGGRALRLGGVTFAGEAALEGHSDADVVLHAAMDALLGAAGLEDIGAHFPPTEERWAGADSRELAQHVAALVREAGYEIVNLDLTLLAESPRIRPRTDEMRHAIAACLGLDAGRVGLKATTLERLGALGRGEGIACQAAALLERRD